MLGGSSSSSGPHAAPAALPAKQALMNDDLPAYQFDEAVALVSLHSTDTLRVCGISSDNDFAAIRTAIASSWPRGIDRMKEYTRDAPRGVRMFKFKLHGTPWVAQGPDAVSARRLVVAVFRTLLALGWRLALTSDTSKREHDKDAWILLRSAPYVVPDPTYVFAVSFNRSDRLRVIGGPDDVPVLVRSVLDEYWARGLAHVRDYEGAVEFKLNGNPWHAYGTEESMAARWTVAQLLANLRNCGYTVYASIDMRYNGSDDYSDIDSWVVVKDLPPTNGAL
ncbi:hypothetical protein AMAG_01311 [Allomyces macrogynus ATCC 38327]|uniref:Uncharacterized protein n=1 Tax=Allomyces macrogynus (strain ATCC 38327) TaxID=578462 RepID=A0A0L0RZ46_ALLM3|nr:hypothetical protein AMAG_01311 [Allomyces macrogynus ATCC 38327]|eukprot:KNE55415.1 hypothetical protein AMAG_01311 [Allomyces macrogynus ATCC 38327]